jgi:hypothetical protein
MMKKIFFVIIFVLAFIGAGYSQVTDDTIRQAATLLGVPFADLKQFIQSYQNNNSSEEAIEIT